MEQLEAQKPQQSPGSINNFSDRHPEIVESTQLISRYSLTLAAYRESLAEQAGLELHELHQGAHTSPGKEEAA